MNARCKDCNKHTHWRTTRGFKLLDHLCYCGGDLEMLSSYSINGVDTEYPDQTIGKLPTLYRHVYMNRKKEIFYRMDDYYIPILTQTPFVMYHGQAWESIAIIARRLETIDQFITQTLHNNPLDDIYIRVTGLQCVMGCELNKITHAYFLFNAPEMVNYSELLTIFSIQKKCQIFKFI